MRVCLEPKHSEIEKQILKRYEEHFNEKFPIFEYCETVITEESNNRLEVMINDCIERNEKVVTPEGYWERIY